MKRAIVSFMFIIAYERNEWMDGYEAFSRLSCAAAKKESSREENPHFLAFLAYIVAVHVRVGEMGREIREKNYLMKTETSDMIELNDRRTRRKTSSAVMSCRVIGASRWKP